MGQPFLNNDGVLRRHKGTRTQIIVPKQLRPLVRKELHENMGHLGVDRTLDLATERFYWPYMQRCRTPYQTRLSVHKIKDLDAEDKSSIKPITIPSPFELVVIDFLYLEKSSGRYEYILVVMDHFTPYAHAFATRNNSTKTVAQKLYNFILRFGFPLRIHHDLGENLKTASTGSWRSCVAWNILVQPLITPKGTVKSSDSTGHFWECFVPCKRPRNHVCQNT